MSQITINNNHSFKVEEREGMVFLDDEEFTFDLQQIDSNIFHILHQNKSFNAEIVSIDRESKMGILKINGNEYHVSLKDQYDLLLANMGMSITKKNNTAVLKAPMPGMVLNIMVKEGDSLKKGDDLLVLEAMKMENIIKCSDDVIIKSIDVITGTIVEKNQVLVTFE